MKIQPFRIAVEDQELADLRRRLEQTRWPSQLPGLAWATGMDVDFLRTLTKYWLEEFDWRRIETDLNRVPHFEAVTESGSIHFVHLRSTAKHACRTSRHIEPEALARLVGRKVTLATLATRMRCSQCGKKVAEVVAVARPRPRG